MTHRRILPSVLILLSWFASNSLAEKSGALGGPFVQYHFSSINRFDSEVGGYPLVIGGIGLGSVGKNFRLGGAGGGGFLWSPTDNAHFGMGYGGIVGEYSIAPWFSVRMMIGGGGYSLAKVLLEDATTLTVERVNSGSFLLFHPSLNFKLDIHQSVNATIGIGYFLPNVVKLHSVTMTVTLQFGR